MDNLSTNNLSRNVSQEQNQSQQQRPFKKKTQKEKGIGQADYYAQFMNFQFESAEQQNYLKSKPKKYSQR